MSIYTKLTSSPKALLAAAALSFGGGVYVHNSGHDLPMRNLQKKAPQAAYVLDLQQQQSEALATVLAYQLAPHSQLSEPAYLKTKHKLSHIGLEIAQLNSVSLRQQGEQAYESGKMQQRIRQNLGVSSLIAGVGLVGCALAAYRRRNDIVQYHHRCDNAKPIN
jgi:hypothetical protein